MSLTLLLLGCHDYSVVSHVDAIHIPGWDSGARWNQDLPGEEVGLFCDKELPDAVQIDESCFVQVSTGDLQATVEWELTTFQTYPEYRDVLMAPVVGELSGDGTPDLVVVTDAGSADEVDDRRQGVMRLLDGATGQEHWSVQSIQYEVDDRIAQVFPYRYSNVAIGDIDGDGEGEILVVAMVLNGPPEGEGGRTDTDIPQVDPHPPNAPPSDEDIDSCYLSAFEADGTLKWVAWERLVRCAGHAPLLADLDGNGRVEAVLGNLFFDAETGELNAVGEGGIGGTRAYRDMGVHSIAADLDGDGKQEVIAGNTVYRHDGSMVCTTGLTDGFAAVADLDGDGLGELAVVGDGRMELFEHDCSPIGGWELSGGGNGGPPTIADFDADGQPEVGVADASTYAVYEVDGTVLWTRPVQDASSHATGSAVFDFEADGHPEVVYADETTLWILDGSTGAVRLQDGRHESRTLHELPTVVDVDGDGQAEIIVPNGGSHHDSNSWGLYVLGGVDHDWVQAGTVWNQHAFSITNIGADLSVPASPQSNWPQHNNFRSGDLYGGLGGQRPEPTLVAEACAEECALGHAVLKVAVGNAGLGALGPSELVVRDESGQVLATATTGWAQSGALSPVVEFDLDPTLTRVSVELRPHALECDPDDEEKIWVEISCL